jgi:hypothetical protein
MAEEREKEKKRRKKKREREVFALRQERKSRARENTFSLALPCRVLCFLALLEVCFTCSGERKRERSVFFPTVVITV